MILFKDALVFRASGLARASVLVDGTQVAAVGDVEPPTGTRVIEAGEFVLGPGFVDLHTHLREPGETWKEDLATGSAAAAAGGFTGVIAMPNTHPPTDNAKTVAQIRSRASEVGLVEVIPAGALTRAREGIEMADFDDMYEAGVRFFTDDGDAVADAGLLRRIMSYLADFPDVVIAEHPEDRTVSAGGHLNEGAVSAAHGVTGLPAVAEELVVARDLALAADTGARLHLQHLSTAGALARVRLAKAEGLDVTCEVTPHHLLLDEAALEHLDPNLKMYPPLRTAEDRAMLVGGLIDGTVDVVATDHAPHAVGEKDAPFEEAPRGVIGLETAASAALEALGGDVAALFQCLSVSPARIAGLGHQGTPVEPGAPANLVLFDPARSWVPETFRSRSANSPFLGRRLQGEAVMTVFQGRIAHEADVHG